MVKATIENIMEVPLKGEIVLPQDPAVLYLRVYAEKTRIRKDTCTQASTAAPFTIAKMWRHTKYSWTDEQLKKKSYMHTVEYD